MREKHKEEGGWNPPCFHACKKRGATFRAPSSQIGDKERERGKKVPLQLEF